MSCHDPIPNNCQECPNYDGEGPGCKVDGPCPYDKMKPTLPNIERRLEALEACPYMQDLLKLGWRPPSKQEPAPTKESWECPVSPLERLAIIEAVKDGELLYDAHKRIVGKSPEESKTIPQVGIDAFKDDEAALLQEHLKKKEEEESLIDEFPPNPPLSESPWSEDHPSPVSLIPGVIKHPIQCCRECVPFHQSKARQLVSLADPDASNDGCKCRCHKPSPTEEPFVLDYETFERAVRGHPLIEVVFEPPKKDPQRPDFLWASNRSVYMKMSQARINDENLVRTYIEHLEAELLIKSNESDGYYKQAMSLGAEIEQLKVEELEVHPFHIKCPKCGMTRSRSMNLCPKCGKPPPTKEVDIARKDGVTYYAEVPIEEPDDMIGRGGTDPNEREKE